MKLVFLLLVVAVVVIPEVNSTCLDDVDGPLIEGCMACNPNNDRKCRTCADGLILSRNKKKCSPTPTATSMCPSSHPYVYHDGDYCCQHDTEKTYAPDGERCDAGPISFTSSCCREDAFTPCATSICSNYGGDEVTESVIEDSIDEDLDTTTDAPEPDTDPETVCEYASIGCWTDRASRAIATLEGVDSRLTGSYQARANSIELCYEAAKERGFSAFGVQNGGWCAASATALTTYNRYGAATNCAAGKGGPWANDVYEITCTTDDPALDIDECATGHTCDATNAACVDIGGVAAGGALGVGYSCTCNTGFETSDSGVTCTDIDECATGHTCDATNAACIDIGGVTVGGALDVGYSCTCNTGFETSDSGVTCTDIDECATGHTCDANNAVCVDIGGVAAGGALGVGYSCTCNTGFETSDSGVTCTVVCTGRNDGDGECCEPDHPCSAGGGDCDGDSGCQGDLVCGTNNCMFDNAHNDDDCCMEPVTMPTFIALKSTHGNYVSAQEDGTVVADRDRAGPFESFKIEIHDGDKVALKSYHGTYMSAHDDGSLAFDRDRAGPWEQFHVKSLGHGKIAFLGDHGKYVSAEEDGTMVADRDGAGSSETFQFENSRHSF